jgi:outer membrane immunogenic protein
MLRKFYTHACFLALAVIPVAAADMYDPYSQNNQYAASQSSSYSWGGVYGGVVTGYGWGDAVGADTDGGVIGGTAGYNWQQQSIVLGAEGDISYMGVGSSGAAGKFSHNWMGTGRLRAGFAFDRFLVYGTGGVAYSTADLKLAGVGSDNEVHFGWTMGLGMEAAITDRISAKVDYLYTNLDSKTYSVGIGGTRVDPDVNTLRAGINYRF